MPEDFTDHERWGLVIHLYRSIRLEFQIRDKRDALKVRAIIPKFQDMAMNVFFAQIGDATSYKDEFPKEFGEKILAAAKQKELICTAKHLEHSDYLIYDIAAGDFFNLDPGKEYKRIVKILRTNNNPIIEVNEF